MNEEEQAVAKWIASLPKLTDEQIVELFIPRMKSLWVKRANEHG